MATATLNLVTPGNNIIALELTDDNNETTCYRFGRSPNNYVKVSHNPIPGRWMVSLQQGYTAAQQELSFNANTLTVIDSTGTHVDPLTNMGQSGAADYLAELLTVPQ